MNVLQGIMATASLMLTAQAEPPAPPADPALKEQFARLQGCWEVTARDDAGRKASAAELKGCTVFFGRNAVLLRGAKNDLQLGLLELDPSVDPRHIDVTMVRGATQGKSLVGIFALEGDTLKMCFDTEGGNRPSDFTAPAGSKRQVLTCKRIAPKKDEQLDIVGAYKSVATELDGRAQSADVAIERAGDAYVVVYERKNAVAYVGIGMRKGDVFSVSWLGPGQLGITMYKIEAGPRLIGQYTQLGGPGILNDETLTHQRKEGSQRD